MEDPEAASPSPVATATKTTWDSDNDWEKRLHVMTHILTSPTTAPPLSAQFLVASQVPSYLNWEYYPPAAQPANLHLRWGFCFFLKRVSGLGAPTTSWRSMCPYLQPPPLSLAGGVEPARWSVEARTAYAKKRIRKRWRVIRIHPLIGILLPHLMVLALVNFWDPFPPLKNIFK